MPTPASQAAEALTADIAFARYKDHFDHDALIQNGWHKRGDGGRDLACGLGALGPDINSPSDCPAAVMPRWLANMVPWLFDGQPFDDAKLWGLDFYAELKRLGGKAPFSVVYDWNANVVAPLGLEWREIRKVSPDATKAVQALHLRALSGDVAPRAEWREALRPMLRESCAYADADADAYVYANANAYAYAYANAYADAYAYANANAYANADAYANANADADADAKNLRRQAAIKRLADGMVECLRKVA